MSYSYAYIENGEILEKHYVLPENGRNVSGLKYFAGDTQLLKSLGWYPVTYATVQYNSNTHYISDHTYEVSTDSVIATPVLQSIPQETIIPFSQRKEEFMESLRAERNRLLSETDWTRLDDVNLATHQRDAWANYRQQLRDLPQHYADNEILSLEQVLWPAKP